jgi:hypothetical protein
MFKEKAMTLEQFLAMCKRMKLLQIKARRTEWEYRNNTHAAHFFLKRSTSKTGLAVWNKIDHTEDL